MENEALEVRLKCLDDLENSNLCEIIKLKSETTLALVFFQLNNSLKTFGFYSTRLLVL